MKTTRFLVRAGIPLVLLAASALLLAQCRPAPEDVIDGPTMLYFYAEW